MPQIASKFDVCWGFAPDPTGGAHSARSPDHVAAFMGREGRGGKGEEEEEEKGEGRDEESTPTLKMP